MPALRMKTLLYGNRKLRYRVLFEASVIVSKVRREFGERRLSFQAAAAGKRLSREFKALPLR